MILWSVYGQMSNNVQSRSNISIDDTTNIVECVEYM